MGYPSKNKYIEDLIKKYPSESAAFDIGFYICSGFQTQQKNRPDDVPAINEDNYAFYEDMCYLLKYKNLSPHSLGMIYRSLFVPLRPKKEEDEEIIQMPEINIDKEVKIKPKKK